jgi:hypothetical protein
VSFVDDVSLLAHVVQLKCPAGAGGGFGRRVGRGGGGGGGKVDDDDEGDAAMVACSGKRGWNCGNCHAISCGQRKGKKKREGRENWNCSKSAKKDLKGQRKESKETRKVSLPTFICTRTYTNDSLKAVPPNFPPPNFPPYMNIYVDTSYL